MRRVVFFFLLLVTGTLGVSGPAVAAPAAPVPADDSIGVNAQWLFPSYRQDSGIWDKQVDAMVRAGVKVVRLDAEWRRVEPNAPTPWGHNYDWRFYDAVVTTLASRGIRWYPIVDYSAPWSASILGSWRSPPASLDAYATYAEALVRRYGKGGTFWSAHPELPQVPVRQWEIWNEQNGSYFWPGAPDPARYAAMYQKARAAIRGADPSATVVVGGLINHSATWFLHQMLVANPGLEMDAVGLHPYAPTIAKVLGWTRAVRSVLTASGRQHTPIEITEVGWTTQGNAQKETDSRRAQLVGELVPTLACEPGVSRVILHTWVSREAYADQPEDWYGLFRPDASPTEAGTAFRGAVHKLRASTAAAPVTSAASNPAPASSAAPASAASKPAKAERKRSRKAKPKNTNVARCGIKPATKRKARSPKCKPRSVKRKSGSTKRKSRKACRRATAKRR